VTTNPPGTSQGDSPSLADLVEDLAARAQAGEPIDLDAYLRDHPRHAERLRGLLPAVGVLARLALSPTANAGPPPPDAEAPAAPPILGDFRLVREVGRGGMGVVYEAEQISLGRRVALKVLPLAATLDPRYLQRFHNEAQAAARLQHPNIVPVHAVGSEQGVHYYAMPFIEGPTLAHVIDDLRRRAGAAGGSDTAPAAADLTAHSIRSREFFRAAARLTIQAAQALHHAHEVGIVHRDVKPANLLLDTAGRLWVADFGLARMQADTALTQTGDLVGTLRYMSPEQALGRTGVVDHRADVYGLGVTLYELLTLRPARTGKDREELLRQLVSEEPPPPRRFNSAVPVDLETIVLKAVAREPAERYATAQDLADDLERFLDTRPIRARRPGLVQRAGKWVQRHPGVVAAVMLALLLLSAGTGLSAILIQREKDQLRREQERTKKALEGEERRGRLARRALNRMSSHVIDDWLARQPRLTAEQRAFLESALADYEELAREAGTDPQMREGLALAYVRIADIQTLLGQQGQAERSFRRGQELYRVLRREHPSARAPLRNLAASENSLGKLLLEAGRTREAVEAHRRALALAQELIARFPDRVDAGGLLVSVQLNLAAALRQDHQLEEAEPLCRQALVQCRQLLRRDPASESGRHDEVRAWHTLAILLSGRGQIRQAEEASRKALTLIQALLRDAPTEPRYRVRLALVLNQLAGVLWQEDRFAEAESAFRDALAVQRKLVEELPGIAEERRALVGVLDNLSALLQRQGRHRDAETVQREAVLLSRQLVHQDRASAAQQADLANRLFKLAELLRRLGRAREAETAGREAAALRQELLRKTPHDPVHRFCLARIYAVLGRLLYEAGDRKAARAMHQDATSLSRALVREEPANVHYRAQLADGYFSLALVDKFAGNLERAEAAYREAVGLLWQVVRDAPDVVDCQAQLANAYNNLGTTLLAHGRLPEAAAACRAALAIRSKLADRQPGLVEPLMDLAGTCDNLALTLMQGRWLAEAETLYGRNVGLRERLTAARPDDPELHYWLASALHNLAVLLLVRKEPALARARVEKALAHQRQALRKAPNHPRYLGLFRGHHRLLFDILVQLGEHSEAAITAERFAGLSSDRLEDAYAARDFLARCAYLARRDANLPEHCRSEAARLYGERGRDLIRACLRRRGDIPQDCIMVARALCWDPAMRDAGLAVELAREATRTRSRGADGWNALGLAHYRGGDWKAARAALEESMQLSKGGDGRDWFLMAMTCWQTGRRVEARRWYSRAAGWMEGRPRPDTELVRLRAEARALLGAGGGKP
jgi:tetratricopeptide (TPR) repeat protein